MAEAGWADADLHSEEKGLLFLSILVWLDGSDRRGVKAAGGTKENAQTSVTQARLWVLPLNQTGFRK